MVEMDAMSIVLEEVGSKAATPVPSVVGSVTESVIAQTIIAASEKNTERQSSQSKTLYPVMADIKPFTSNHPPVRKYRNTRCEYAVLVTM